MNRNINRCAAVLISLCVLLAGCSAAQTMDMEDVTIVGCDDYRAKAAVFDQGSRVYMALYESKLFYMEMTENADFTYYLYDLKTAANKKIKTIHHAVVQDKARVWAGDKLYFSVHAGEHGVYVMDFSSCTIKKVLTIPADTMLQTVYDGQVLLRSKIDSEQDEGMFSIVTIDDNGDTGQVLLGNKEALEWPLLDNNGQALCALERESTDDGTRFCFVKYSDDLQIDEKVEVTSLFSEYEITDAIGQFDAFGSCFCIRDFSGNMIICKAEQGKLSVLLCDSNIRYIENFAEDCPHALFRSRDTDELYVLDTETGEIQKYNCTFEDGSSAVRNVVAYGDSLLFIKETE